MLYFYLQTGETIPIKHNQLGICTCKQKNWVHTDYKELPTGWLYVVPYGANEKLTVGCLYVVSYELNKELPLRWDDMVWLWHD